MDANLLLGCLTALLTLLTLLLKHSRHRGRPGRRASPFGFSGTIGASCTWSAPRQRA